MTAVNIATLPQSPVSIYVTGDSVVLKCTYNASLRTSDTPYGRYLNEETCEAVIGYVLSSNSLPSFICQNVTSSVTATASSSSSTTGGTDTSIGTDTSSTTVVKKKNLPYNFSPFPSGELTRKDISVEIDGPAAAMMKQARPVSVMHGKGSLLLIGSLASNQTVGPGNSSIESFLAGALIPTPKSEWLFSAQEMEDNVRISC